MPRRRNSTHRGASLLWGGALYDYSSIAALTAAMPTKVTIRMPKFDSDAIMQATWPEPVLLALEEPGQYVSIATTQAASWAMIEDWPIEDGPALDRALLICADVIKGKRTNDEARLAFIAAAVEAGIDIKT